MHRVLRKGGLCYLNFISVDDKSYDEGEANNLKEVITKEGAEQYLHSFYEDYEPDKYFNDFEIVYKEKINIQIGRYYNTGCTCILDYIVKKNRENLKKKKI